MRGTWERVIPDAGVILRARGAEWGFPLRSHQLIKNAKRGDWKAGLGRAEMKLLFQQNGVRDLV